MKLIFYSFVVQVIILHSCSTSKGIESNPSISKYKQVGYIEVIDPSLDTILNRTSKCDLLAKNLSYSDGPVWDKKSQRLLFSETKKNIISQWSEAKGVSMYLDNSGYTKTKPRKGFKGSAGLAITEDGSLLICQQGDKIVSFMAAPLQSPKQKYIPLFNKYLKRNFFGPHDIAVDSLGNVYFIDALIGVEDYDPNDKNNLPFKGLYSCSRKGIISQIEDAFTKPNGVAISSNNEYIIVSNSDPKNPYWFRLDFSKNGQFMKRGKIAIAKDRVKKENGLPDGLTIHPDDYIFATGPDGIWIMTSKGKLLGIIHTIDIATNVTFNDDHTFIYITTEDKLLRFPIKS